MWIELVLRWAHVGTAIVLLGGSVFMRFVLMPAAAALPDDQHQALRQRIMGRWKAIVMAGIALLLVSGFYNYLTSTKGAGPSRGLYHALMGIKILLAFGVFFLASALTGRAAAFEAVRRDAKRWLGVLILLAALVVAIGGVLKVVVKEPPANAAGVPAAADCRGFC
jgi:uncharacterized membrane protein